MYGLKLCQVFFHRGLSLLSLCITEDLRFVVLKLLFCYFLFNSNSGRPDRRGRSRIRRLLMQL